MHRHASRLGRFHIGNFFFQLSVWTLRLFLVCFPFQIRALFYTEPFYLTGNFNAYRSIFIYLSDILLLITLISFGLHCFINKKPIHFGNHKITFIWGLLVLSLGMSILFAENKTLSFLLWLRWLEGLGLYLIILNQVLSFKNCLHWFFGGIALQSAIAVGQFIHQASLGLHFLGEPELGQTIAGVAKLEFSQLKIVRPYGTFAHPNILAGSLFLALGFSMLDKKIISKKFRFLKNFSLVLSCLAFLLTFSRSAFLAALVTAGVYLFIRQRKTFKNISIAAILVIVAATVTTLFWKENPLYKLLFSSHGEALEERLTYIVISLKMFLAHPFGVGLGHFTFAMQDYTTEKLSPWLFQPVHNILLLVLNEGGIIAALLLLLLLVAHLRTLTKILKYFKPFSGTESNTIKKKAGLFLALTAGLVVIGLFDHYFVTSPSGQTLLFLFGGLLGLFLNEVSEKMAIPL